MGALNKTCSVFRFAAWSIEWTQFSTGLNGITYYKRLHLWNEEIKKRQKSTKTIVYITGIITSVLSRRLSCVPFLIILKKAHKMLWMTFMLDGLLLMNAERFELSLCSRPLWCLMWCCIAAGEPSPPQTVYNQQTQAEAADNELSQQLLSFIYI